jgi:aconitate hydratase
VLSGNRNFASRVHAQVRAAYLASPALVVALAVVGHVRVDLERDPLGIDHDGRPVYLRDLWPTDDEVAELAAACVTPDLFAADGPDPESMWEAIAAPDGASYPWAPDSTYIRSPSYVDPVPRSWGTTTDPTALTAARVLVALGDDISTDHISPVGAIPPKSPAGRYLAARGVRDLNSYGARRGNHEVMARGTFSNPRLPNHLLADGAAEHVGEGGGDTLHVPTGKRMPVYEAAGRYARSGTPLIVLAGRNYGMGSSRDWAAKGPWLLGVRAVLAESFERIHRSNLCAMGIVPLAFPEGCSWRSLGLTGHEEFRLKTGRMRETGFVEVTAGAVSFRARADVPSAGEWDILLAGGMLPFLLDRLTGTRA